ncbi:hypothetical protein [Providencia vermicola]|uniref:hypothetical protein n=1 Tax=Providencia vermicola TaxID=333965 RepID=UPI0032D9CB46
MLECLALEDSCIYGARDWIYENWSWGLFIAVLSLWFTSKALKKTDKANKLAEISLSITRESLVHAKFSADIAESEYKRVRLVYELNDAQKKYKYILIKQILEVKLLWYKTFLNELKDSLSGMKKHFSSDTLIHFVRNENFTSIVFLGRGFILRNEVSFSFDALSELISIDIDHKKGLSTQINNLEMHNKIINYHLSMYIVLVGQKFERENSVDIETINTNIDFITNHLYEVATRYINSIETSLV